MTGRARIAIFGLPVVGCLLAATILLFPSDPEIAAAKRRAIIVLPHPMIAPLPQTPENLALRFVQGKPLSVPELRQLLAFSTATADAESLSAMADRIGARAPVSTAQITQDILASGRPGVARAFFEQRPDRALASLWRLRFELHRQTNDIKAAESLLRAAATNPGTAQARDLIEAAYEMDLPELVVVAAEQGSVPPLSRALSLDLAQRAAGSKRYDLIARIDRVGTVEWRQDDPWLAMSLAQRSGETAAALRYAALLPSGQAAAREAIILASGDRQAIRTMLLAHARTAKDGRAAIAQQLLEAGFRADAIALLRLEGVGRAPDDPLAARLLYLMGPRPDAEGLAWLRSRATGDPRWLKIYMERERPAVALAFIEAHRLADGTEMLLQRLKLASAARDRQAAARALVILLDGRALTPTQLSAATANVPAGLDSRFKLALARARITAGAALPSDRLDLAWDAWNQHNPQETFDQLQAYLRLHPDDQAALRLMADVEAKRRGNKAAWPWLERALVGSPARSRERAEILEMLGRTPEAIAVVETLRQDSPGDKRLAIIHARLLVAAGDPGRARKVLQP